MSGTNNLVYNNLIYSSRCVLVVSANTNNNTPTCSNNKIYNNTFVSGKRIYVGHNVDPDNGCFGNEIVNNIFSISDDTTIQFTTDSASGGVSWYNNCFYSQKYQNFKVFVDDTIINDFNEWQNGNTIKNNYNTDPLINIDGKPLSNSICLGSGLIKDKVFYLDYNNNFRLSTNWDIGCYRNTKAITITAK